MSYICNLYPVALVIVLLNDWSLEEADANGANGVDFKTIFMTQSLLLRGLAGRVAVTFASLAPVRSLLGAFMTNHAP